MPLPNVDLGNAPTGTPPDSGEKTQLRSALGLAIGTDVQAFDAKLALGAGVAFPFVVAFKNVTVLTSGAPADIASVQLPAWCTRWILYWNNPTRCIAEAAAGTLAAAVFNVLGVAGGGGMTLSSISAGPASTAVAATGNAPSLGVPPQTSNIIYLRQTVNSANAGTISVYALIVPLL
jgi:hypothetical protein